MIPVNEPLLAESEIKYVTECVRTGWISSAGHFITEFEEQWAKYCGRTYGVAVSNGTVALQLAVACLDLQPGDEVIIPTFTIISCATAIILNGGIPVLVDADPDTFCMDVQQIEEKITSRTRAIMVVHLYGHPVDMNPVLEIAEKHGLFVIEDAAEAHGAEYLSDKPSSQGGWRRCGSFGVISTFSFYANKLITTGEGGMLLMDDLHLAEKARSMRNLCFVPGRRFYHEELGFNFRLTNLQAALGIAQVERIDKIVERKRWLGGEYTQQLKDVSGLQLPIEKPWAHHIYWMYAIVLDDALNMDAAEFAKRLKERGVETRPFFLGMHEQPVFHRRGLFLREKYPIAERIARKGLYLPSGLALTETQLQQVSEAVKDTLLS